MATCKYTFTGADGKSTTVEGIPALKEFLLQGALEQYLPSRAAEMLAPKADDDVGTPFNVAFSGRQTPASEWPRAEEPDGFEGKPGDYITVFRLANMVGLSNANAASLKGLSTYLSMVDDPDTSAGSEGEKSDTIFVYKVQVPKSGFGDYEMRRGGKAAGLVKMAPSGQAGRGRAKYGGYWYSFPQETKAEQLMSIPLAKVRAALKASSAPTAKQIEEYKKELAAGKNPFPLNFSGTTSFDYAGTEKGTAALRKAFTDADAPAFSKKQKVDLNAKLEQLILSDFEGAVREYSDLKGTEGGKKLDTDIARNLSPEYRKDRSLAPKVHKAANAFTQKMYEARIAEVKPGGVVLFMSGGGGAGKSSAEDLLSKDMDVAHTIYDGTLSSLDKAKNNIQLALDKQQAVMIAHVYRDAEDALVNGVFRRAMDPDNGRTVTLKALVKSHADSNLVLRQLNEAFKNNPAFLIKTIDNSRGKDNYAEIDFADLPVVGREGLLEKLQDATEKEYAEGRIDERVYLATLDDLEPRANGGRAKTAEDVQGNEQNAQTGREPSGQENAVSRAEQKNAAASRVSNVSSDRFKRTDELQQAVTDLQEGKITQDEYNAMVDNLRPVYPYEKVPALTTPADAKYALANGRGQSLEKAAKYGLPSDTLAKGDFAQLRLDIPSYQEHDAWVVSVHTPKSTNRQVQAAYDAGTVIGYESAAAMTDATFGMNQKAATKIAQGTSKGTIATILGKWKPISNQAAKVRADAAIKDPAWTQVGMDPFRHSYFYDRDTMRPVLSADEVIQLGPLVLAKNATFSEDGTDITGAPIAFSSKQAAQGQRFTLRDETYTGAVQRNLQDYFARVKDVQDALAAQGGTVGEAQNVYLAEELSYGRLQEQMVDFKEDVLKPLLKATKAAGLELSDLALYAYAKHAPERNQAIAARNKTFGKGEGSGMTTSEANNIMRAFKAEGKDADLANLHAQLMQITQATRLVLLNEGLITQDQFDALQTQYADYVPLRGFVEDEDPESGRAVSGPRVGGKGFNIRGKETMRALGRESRAGHVIENIVIDYERAVARAERNAVAKVFLDLATTNPDPGLWEIDAERTKAAFDRATGQVKYNTLIDKGEDTISVKIDGNEIYVKVKDPLLLRALRNASKDETGALDRILAMSLGRFTALMRNTLTRYNPAFGFTNAVKDIGFGAVSALSDLGPKGTALYLKNYANPRQSGPMFEEFRAAGATTGGWHVRDQQEMQKELQRLIEWEGGSSVKSTAYSMARGTLDALEFIGQYSETQARFAAYKAARELNKSPAEAASIAKNLTTNFNRRGEWGSTMNTMYLFFNAGVQGSVKIIKNLRSPYVMAAMTGLTGLSAGLAFMAAGVGGDDDDDEAYWDKIPQFEKERNLIIMLPPGEGMMIKGVSTVGKNGRYLKLPIQYGLNVFSTLGYQMADLARYGQDRTRGVSPAKAAINMVSVTFGSFNPFGGGFNPSKPAEVALAVSPTVVDLGVQALLGVNSFGTPVAPRKYDDNKPDAENFGPGMAGTWEQRLARWLSESTGGDRAVGGAIDVSPGSIRNIVRNLTGGTGDFLSSVFVNIPSKMWSPDGEVGPRDVPVLKAFYGEVDDVTDSKLFYERKAEVMEAANQASDRQKLGIEVTYDAKSQGLQSLGNAAKSFTKKMTQLRKEELRIAEDPDLTDTQKKAQRKQVRKERAEIASEFNAAYYDMKKGVAKEERQKEALAAEAAGRK